MRYEAKNKSLATRLGNFINLPYSLAMRHQQLQCYKEVIGHELEVGPGDTVSTDILWNMGMSLSNTDTPYRYVSIVIQTYSCLLLGWYYVHALLLSLQY